MYFSSEKHSKSVKIFRLRRALLSLNIILKNTFCQEFYQFLKNSMIPATRIWFELENIPAGSLIDNVKRYVTQVSVVVQGCKTISINLM